MYLRGIQLGNLVISRFDNEWVDVTYELDIQCCDCGLVHREEYRIVRDDGGQDHIIGRVVRDNRATANRRRSMKAKKEGIWADLKGIKHGNTTNQRHKGK